MTKSAKTNDAQTGAAEAPEPNVMLVAKDKDGKPDITKALTTIRSGSGTIELPARELQADPFYLDQEKADRLTAEFKFLYKPFVPVKNS